MVSLTSEVTKLAPRLEAVKADVVSGITHVLEERAIGAGTVTRDGLQQAIGDALNPVMAMLQRLSSSGTAAVVAPVETAAPMQ